MPSGLSALSRGIRPWMLGGGRRRPSPVGRRRSPVPVPPAGLAARRRAALRVRGHQRGQVDVPGDLGDAAAVRDEIPPVLHPEKVRGGRDGEACSWICSTRMPAAPIRRRGHSDLSRSPAARWPRVRAERPRPTRTVGRWASLRFGRMLDGGGSAGLVGGTEGCSAGPSSPRRPLSGGPRTLRGEDGHADLTAASAGVQTAAVQQPRHHRSPIPESNVLTDPGLVRCGD